MFSHKCDCDYHHLQDSYERKMLLLVVFWLELVGNVFYIVKDSQRNKYQSINYIDSLCKTVLLIHSFMFHTCFSSALCSSKHQLRTFTKAF